MMIFHRPSRNSRITRRPRGVATVEFVITMPLVLLLILGVTEIGRAFVHYATLSYAIRDSARYVSENSINGTTGVVTLTSTTITRAKNRAVYGNIAGAGNPKLPNYQTGHVTVVNAGGDNIRVVALYPYQPMIGNTMPFLSGSVPLSFNMHIAVTMRAIS